jgi:hypothetical protein
VSTSFITPPEEITMHDLSSPPAGSLEQHVLMGALGIRHTLLDQFHYRDYRYTNLQDAIAQARRDLKP